MLMPPLFLPSLPFPLPCIVTYCAAKASALGELSRQAAKLSFLFFRHRISACVLPSRVAMPKFRSRLHPTLLSDMSWKTRCFDFHPVNCSSSPMCLFRQAETSRLECYIYRLSVELEFLNRACACPFNFSILDVLSGSWCHCMYRVLGTFNIRCLPCL